MIHQILSFAHDQVKCLMDVPKVYFPSVPQARLRTIPGMMGRLGGLILQAPVNKLEVAITLDQVGAAMAKVLMSMETVS
jgi:hypothetical protein